MSVDVAVTVIHSRGKILVVYNPQWGMFTLPMTKVRWSQSPAHTEVGHRRAWVTAALRNVMECLGKTTTDRVSFLSEITDIRQSERDGSGYHELEHIGQLPMLIEEWTEPL